MSKGLTFVVGLQLCGMIGLKIPKVRQLEGRIYRLATLSLVRLNGSNSYCYKFWTINSKYFTFSIPQRSVS